MIITDHCTGCQLCIVSCYFGAISVDILGKCHINLRECCDCMVCVGHCPVYAIIKGQGVPVDGD